LMIIGLQLTNQALIDARHRDVVVERSRTWGKIPWMIDFELIESLLKETNRKCGV
jgi:hypothetical protein